MNLFCLTVEHINRNFKFYIAADSQDEAETIANNDHIITQTIASWDTIDQCWDDLGLIEKGVLHQQIVPD